MVGQGFKLAGTLVLACMASSAIAKPAWDFGAIEICSKLKAMPKGYSPLPGDCKLKAPLGDCRFTVKGDSWPISYLVERGRLLDKYLELKDVANFTGPYGLRLGDGESEASEKLRKATGLSLTRWTDYDEPRTSYLQTDEQDCPGNAYTIRLWFEDGALTAVNVSSLPTI